MSGRSISTSVVAALAVALVAGCGEDNAEISTPREIAAATVEHGLSHPDPWVRAETVRLLGMVDGDAFLPQVTAALEDESPLTQTAAIELLLERGHEAAEEAALGRLVSGSSEQRVQLLRLIVRSADTEFRREAVVRALRDVNISVRVAGLEALEQIEGGVTSAELMRMVEDDNQRIADSAFLRLAERSPTGAMEYVLEGMRSDDREEVLRAMAFARHLAIPELWPAMRSYVLSDVVDDELRELALLVLGHLADPSVEDDLRTIVLAGDEEDAARALYAISYIPTERAQQQAAVHKRDNRTPVRRAALSALIRQQAPLSVFETVLTDPHADIAQRALLHLKERDPAFAAQAYIHMLDEAEDPAPVVWALYEATRHEDMSEMIDAASERLEALARSTDPVVANLATRLLYQARAPDVATAREVLASGQPWALYALLEATLATDVDYSELYTAALDSDLFTIRLAGAIGIWRLGDRYQPPVDEDA